MENYEQLMSDTIRFLAADMVQQANSGHPGMPMGLADIATVFSRYYRHNPKNPHWLNRDRLVFSGGHGTGLIYSLLYLWGYDLTLDDLKRFRQLGSKTPGHPEYGHTPGVEVTTGPLGQGVANAVGFAMAAKRAAAMLNTPEVALIDHKVYCFCGDGDLQEGIGYEACSLAGHLKLDNLILIYDSNNITIEGETNLAFSEMMQERFRAQRWDVVTIDGHDFDAIDAALSAAQKQERPFVIIAKTKIARGAATMEGSHHTHGAPLGQDEIKASKIKAGFPTEPFTIPDAVLARFRSAIEMGDLYEREWNKKVASSSSKQRMLLEKLKNPEYATISWPSFEVGKSIATRDSNGQILQAIAQALPGFLGGSADLAPSNKTELKGMGDFPAGRNIHFGIREHAMGAITNAMALYGLFLPFAATFFVFSDYLKPSLRVAALMGVRAFFIFTHDSIGVGEDGPTHQPIEHLTSLRALPKLMVWRPADAQENVVAWQTALTYDGPSAFVLSRQGLPVLDKSEAIGSAHQGGYLLSTSQHAVITLVATGSEVALAQEAAALLRTEGIGVNVASIPCYDLFVRQDRSYQESIILPTTKVLAIEAASGLEWYKIADDVVAMESFGASGKDKELFAHFGFTPKMIAKRAKELIG
ncbi:MAG: transketolase [Campylobacterales bacterium]